MLRTSSPLQTDLPFHPVVANWFRRRFREPTEPQRLGWAEIVQGRNTLIAAPTGSGKTLAAFLASIDQLVSRGVSGDLPDTVQVVYVSPLKALSNDIHRNLEVPLAEIRQQAEESGALLPTIRTAVRTGDTPQSERQAMLRRPPHILVTTPESLFLLVTSAKSRETLRHVQTVIVDEIHALARDKRGSHLALTLERLDLLCERRPVRVGLSATQRPMEEIAHFLVGNAAPQPDVRPHCSIVDVGHLRELDLAVEVPPSELSAVCSHEQWEEIYADLQQQIESHRSTLVFVNTRRMAERVAHRLIQVMGEDAVASHHGSLARQIRLSAEERLKRGELKAIVATASLELGIDVGYIDLVCQIGSPRSIATFLQRVGRSGHALGLTPKGRLFPLTRDELLECLALIRSVRGGRLDRVEIPQAPLDVLAQQIVAMTACEPWDEDALYEAVRRAQPYRDLTRDDYQAVLKMLSEGISAAGKQGAYLHRDLLGGQLRARRGARIAAITSGGTIPETGDYRVVTEHERTFVGTLNEDFAIESVAGDIFLLGNSSWRIRYVRGGEVTVVDAHGAPATVPFWLGEGLGRTAELSTAVSELREEVAQRIDLTATSDRQASADEGLAAAVLQRAVSWLEAECAAPSWAAHQAAHYVAAQVAACGRVPTQRSIVFERFFDESGGMQLVIHAPFGARVNRAWGLALRKRFCRSFDFELQAAADDNAVLLSIGPQHSFPIDALFKMLNPHNAEHLLVQALLAAPMFQTRWRWNVTRALAVLRYQGGKKVPPFLQRFRSDDLLAAVFPETVGCLENHSGDVEIPDHPLVRQTLVDCLHEAMNLEAWLRVLQQFQQGDVQFVASETREPSPFAHEILNANPYSFLDDAPLEERRVRAVSTRRTLSIESMRDLGRLDPAAIELVTSEAWPTVRDADELHDAMMTVGAFRADEAVGWKDWFEQLVRAGRATALAVSEGSVLWAAAERWPMLRAVYPQAESKPHPQLPAMLDTAWERSDAVTALVRGRVQMAGPTTAADLASALSLDISAVGAALEALEGEGAVMRGSFTPDLPTEQTQWCDRRLLARIHRLTLDGLRKQIQPVSPQDYWRFLAAHHRLVGAVKNQGISGVRSAIEQLQGFEMAAGSWESRALPARVVDYQPELLDQLSMSGQLVWGRVNPPRREGSNRTSTAGLTRAGSISLMLREDMPWLLPSERSDGAYRLRGNAQLVLETLQARGALFYHELKRDSELLDAHLDDALQELAAAGLITADTFGAVRWIAARNRHANRRRSSGRRALSASPATSGRWSLFPGVVQAPDRATYLNRWAQQLLKRWGVVFRDLWTRESIAPAWSELLPVYRRMEARGEVRGGRFVSGVAGEQYGLPATVDQLRRVRDEAPNGDWFVVAANDPLNLTGVLSGEQRVPAVHTFSVALRDGQLLASRQTAGIEFAQSMPPEQVGEISRRLRRGEW